MIQTRAKMSADTMLPLEFSLCCGRWTGRRQEQWWLITLTTLRYVSFLRWMRGYLSLIHAFFNAPFCKGSITTRTRSKHVVTQCELQCLHNAICILIGKINWQSIPKLFQLQAGLLMTTSFCLEWSQNGLDVVTRLWVQDPLRLISCNKWSLVMGNPL